MKYKTMPLKFRIERYTLNPKYYRQAALVITTALAGLSYFAMKTGNTLPGVVLIAALVTFVAFAIRYDRTAKVKVEERVALFDFKLSYDNFAKHRLSHVQWGSPEWFDALQPFAKVATEQGDTWKRLLRDECQRAKTSYVTGHQAR